MDSTLTLELLGALIVVLVGMLIVVRVARRLETGSSALRPRLRPWAKYSRPRAPTAKVTASKPSATAEDKGAAAIRAVLGGDFVSTVAAARAVGAAMPARKRIAIVVAGVAAATSIAVGVVMAQVNKERNSHPVESEIAAGALHGTMLSPSDRAPVVLIVPGSGPTDRDGNSPAGVKGDTYRMLAEDLSHEGIATVRVDKRGMFGSAGAGDPSAVSVDIYANDYRAWIDAIKAERHAKCIWLLGHSEGALMVSAAAEGRKDVCGLILVSGMGRKMGDVIRQQLKDNPANAPVLDQALGAIAELEAGRHVDTTAMHPALMPLFNPKVQDYLISIFQVDPVETLRRANVKSLVVQGTTDLQVSEADARLLVKAPRSHIRLIVGMNHMLKEAPADRAANLATYTDPTLPLAPNLVRRIRNFIKDDD